MMVHHEPFAVLLLKDVRHKRLELSCLAVGCKPPANRLSPDHPSDVAIDMRRSVLLRHGDLDIACEPKTFAYALPTDHHILARRMHGRHPGFMRPGGSNGRGILARQGGVEGIVGRPQTNNTCCVLRGGRQRQSKTEHDDEHTRPLVPDHCSLPRRLAAPAGRPFAHRAHSMSVAQGKSQLRRFTFFNPTALCMKLHWHKASPSV